ncbi:hypothetical protein AB6813_07175 [bacterium RCC_150]
MKTRLVAVVCLFIASFLSLPSANAAVPAEALLSPDALGYDVSWPQCGGGLPGGQAFAIIGVNGGRPENSNPCFAEQLAWANTTAGIAGQPKVALYVNTANPGPWGSGWWPGSNVILGAEVPNPYGACDGGPTPACSYIYGYAMASDDANQRGVTNPKQYLWWLDVEFGNAWFLDTVSNAASVEGMAAYFQNIGAPVGIYSTSYQFGSIAGQLHPDSNLNGLKNWIPGASSEDSAKEYCGVAPLTPGSKVTMTQFTDGVFDYNYSCTPPVAPAPPAPPKVVAPVQHGSLTTTDTGRPKPADQAPQS